MSEYLIRVQVLLTVKLRNELDAYKDKHGFTTDSMAIREILTKSLENEQ